MFEEANIQHFKMVLGVRTGCASDNAPPASISAAFGLAQCLRNIKRPLMLS